MNDVDGKKLKNKMIVICGDMCRHHTHTDYFHCPRPMPSAITTMVHKTYKDALMGTSTSAKSWQGWCDACNAWQLEHTLSRDSCGGYYCGCCSSIVFEHTVQQR